MISESHHAMQWWSLVMWSHTKVYNSVLLKKTIFVDCVTALLLKYFSTCVPVKEKKHYINLLNTSLCLEK